MLHLCAHCGTPFEPLPQVPGQTYCSLPDCQRARRRRWQQAKLQTDPDYRVNQRAAQQAWSQRNQGYWLHYRRTRHPREKRHRKQRVAQNARSNDSPAKMDVCDLPNGLYRITRCAESSEKSGHSCIVKITLVRVTRPRKMDASREDVIDTASAPS